LPATPATPNPYLAQKPTLPASQWQLFNSAISAMNNKQWSQAEARLKQLLATNPNLSGAQLNLGNVYYALHDTEKAQTAYQNAIDLNKNNLDAYNQLAILKREDGKFTEAEKLYKDALAVWVFHPSSHKNLAILYELYMGKPELALPHYEAYLSLNGDDKQALSWIADLQRRLGVTPPKKAASEAAADAENVDE
jgi:tetratricopeptide (TPR) repeat protein